jgi:hypothetical protein
MPIPLVPTLAYLAGVKPGHVVDGIDCRPFRPAPAGAVPLHDYLLAVFGSTSGAE